MRFGIDLIDFLSVARFLPGPATPGGVSLAAPRTPDELEEPLLLPQPGFQVPDFRSQPPSAFSAPAASSRCRQGGAVGIGASTSQQILVGARVPGTPSLASRSAPDTPANLSMVEDMLQESEMRITSVVQNANGALAKDLQNEMHTRFRKFDQNVQLQFQQQQADMDTLRKIAQTALANVEKIWTEISNLQGGLATASSVEASDSLDRDRTFAAAPDRSCICLQTCAYVDQESVAVFPRMARGSLAAAQEGLPHWGLSY